VKGGLGTTGRSEFHELARGRLVVPVWRELMADTVTPVGAFAQVVGEGPGFLFESVEGGDRFGRYSFVGRRPLASLVARLGERVEVSGEIDLPEPVRAALGSGILRSLEELLVAYGAPLVEGLPPLHGGFVGYLGYDVVREVERLPDVPPDDLGLPDASLFLIGELCAFDHWRQRVVLVENVLVRERAGGAELDSDYDAACLRLDELAADLYRPSPQPPLQVPVPGEWPEVSRKVSPATYMQAVEVAKEHITAGDIFQVVLSQRFDLLLDADPFDVYRVLRQVNPSPYLYFLRTDACTVVGSSPEPMVRLRDNVVTSRPIAGTRKRGSTEEEDHLLAAELGEHPKERAEHIMLVDLARNDVGRVVRFGTEHVDELMTLERYSHVMHLTSQVSGELAEGKGPVDVLRATIPAGTLSGAPKVRAMQIIDDLEVSKRGVYGGVVGYVDLSGNVDTAIAIRTMVVTPDGRASVQAGAGIVADSDPVEEQAECENKAATILGAVRAAREITQRRLEFAKVQPR
jgi:anthranilate synthase component I